MRWKTTFPQNYQVLYLTMADVRKILHRVTPKKAAVLDNISGKCLENVKTNWHMY